jgi:hypothetical protein
MAMASAMTPTDEQVVGGAGDLSRRFIAFVAAEGLPTLKIDAARMPNIARNVQSAAG